MTVDPAAAPQSMSPADQPPGLLRTYLERVAEGIVVDDTAQREAASLLDAVAGRLGKRLSPAGGLLGWLTGRTPDAPVRGLYLHGGVGRGKTMLMDMFFDMAEVAPKLRIHFHEFMAEVHDRIASARAARPGDPIPMVAASFARDATLLCFDELHITDIADAMIVGRLFAGLFEAGVTVVATSNVAPRDLYRDGLQRSSFLPFIGLIEQHMDVHELSADRDYRLEKLAGHRIYFHPLNAASARGLEETWHRLTGHSNAHAGGPTAGHPGRLVFKGRTIDVSRAEMGVAWFTFAGLCEAPLGAADYLHIAHLFHTVILEGVPVMSPDTRNAARRFINLIDTFYDARVRLVLSADAGPKDLYQRAGQATAENFLFERTASRLIEMQSEAYLAAAKT